MFNQGARGAHRDQVFFGVVVEVTAELFLVNLEARHRAARLIPPAIATRDLLRSLPYDSGSGRKWRQLGPIVLVAFFGTRELGSGSNRPPVLGLQHTSTPVSRQI